MTSNNRNIRTGLQVEDSPDRTTSKHNVPQKVGDKRTLPEAHSSKDARTPKEEKTFAAFSVPAKRMPGRHIDAVVDASVQHATQQNKADSTCHTSTRPHASSAPHAHSDSDPGHRESTSVSRSHITTSRAMKSRTSLSPIVLEYELQDTDELQEHDKHGAKKVQTTPQVGSDHSNPRSQYFPPLSPRTSTGSARKRKQMKSTYQLKSFCFNRIPNFPDAALWCDKQRQVLRLVHLDTQISDDPLDGKIAISEIVKMEYTDSNDAAIIVFYCSKKIGKMNKFGFELESPRDLAELMLDIAELGGNIRQSAPRPVEKMMKIIENIQTELTNLNLDTTDTTEPVPKPSPPSTKAVRPGRRLPERTRLDRHDVSTPNSEPTPTPTLSSTFSARTSDRIRNIGASPKVADESRTMPVAKTLRCQGTPWHLPLVYPKGGKSPESMTWDDLSYLEDGRMLNETPIAVFLRYLRENIAPEQMKKVYFFSTFFYSSLTKAPPGGWPDKNCKINYNAVARWTKNINLFSRDYVVVPIHEASHFYVMIICNLPMLRTTSTAEDDSNLEEAEDGTLEDREVSDGIVAHKGDVSVDLPGLSPQATPRKRGTKKRSAPMRRYDPKAPIIITLDSLNISRSHTASVLKQYIVMEAKDKHNLDISVGDIKGMTATRIPRQANYCDCGLYTCMYIEQFMADPEKFKRTVLQPTGFDPSDGIRWPPDSQISSEDLRQALYEFLQALYQSFEQGTSARIRPVGRILIQPSQEPAEADKIEQARQGIEAYRQYDANRQRRRLGSTNHEGDRDDEDLILVAEESMLIRDKSPEKAASSVSTQGVEGVEITSKYFVNDGATPDQNLSSQTPPNTIDSAKEKHHSSGAQSPQGNVSVVHIDLVSPVSEFAMSNSAGQVIALSTSTSTSTPPSTGRSSKESREDLGNNKQVAVDKTNVKTVADDRRPKQVVMEDTMDSTDASVTDADVQEQPWEGFSPGNEDMMDSVEVPDSQGATRIEVDLDDDMIMKD